MSLVRTSLLNAIAVGIRMLAMLGLNKDSRSLSRPCRLCALRTVSKRRHRHQYFRKWRYQYRCDQYTAEFHADSARQESLWRTAGSISISCSAVAAFVIALFTLSLRFGS